MEGVRFGEFIAAKKKARGLTLRSLAADGPRPTSDIEKSEGTADINMLEQWPGGLVDQSDKETMFDWPEHQEISLTA